MRGGVDGSSRLGLGTFEAQGGVLDHGVAFAQLLPDAVGHQRLGGRAGGEDAFVGAAEQGVLEAQARSEAIVGDEDAVAQGAFAVVGSVEVGAQGAREAIEAEAAADLVDRAELLDLRLVRR